MQRRKTSVVTVGDLKLGSQYPILIQSMTNTPTTDVKATLEQIQRCVDAGVDIMRVSVPDKPSAKSFKEIARNSPVPLVADIHFHHMRGVEAAQNGASCLRINPGTLGKKEHALDIIKAAKDYNCSIRLGVNVGSLEESILRKYHEPCADAMVESAMESIKVLEDNDFTNFKISVKASDVIMMHEAYTKLAKLCDYPFHLGVTEAGPLSAGVVKSSIGVGSLLMNGIGDTIRISLSADVVEEVNAGWRILKSLNIRSRGVNIVSCPSCARQQFDVIKFVSQIEKATEKIIKPIRISILGCVVNGLGEARESDIGITGAGSGNHLIYIKGEPKYKATSDELFAKVMKAIEEVL
ncbi:MAG: (E)-4-hydroxy-3-methylbut-2-enyl-diphosphate synthase [Candidatus Deianiraeaceae bacterium]|jgi:(E)-4-hydroxy-3-methylbut-2-enyl-diphosphate synthase